MIYLQVFFEFFKAGLFAIGGGLATLPFLFDISTKTGWFSSNDIMNLIAISESTPGSLGVNMATYAGVITGGILGGIIATIGLVAPSIIIIEIIAKVFDKFKNAKIVQSMFEGLRPASTGLIAAAGLLVAKTAFINLEDFKRNGLTLKTISLSSVLLAVIIFIGMKKLKLHPIFYIIFSAAAGIVIGYLQ